MIEPVQAANITYPGIRRLSYFLWSIGLTVVFSLGSGLITEGGSNLALALMLGVIIGTLIVTAQRFRNQGSSAWWAAGCFVPLLNVYVGMRALAYQEGYAAQRKLDRAGKIVVTIYLLIFVFAVMAAIAIPAYHDYVQATNAARS